MENIKKSKIKHPQEDLDFKTIMVNEVKYKTLLTDKFKNRKAYEPYNPNIIVAVIPGVIRKHYVKVGDKVKKGDKLVILEAMKMKNDIITPVDGVVKTIDAKIGVNVPKNHVLVVIE